MKKQGFTILEILVVLAVLAILIGIAVPRIKGMQEQANITKAKTELKTIQLAVESYYLNHGEYPDSNGGNEFVLTSKYLLAPQANPQIISGAMIDPFGFGKFTEYFYKTSSNGQYYVIGSVGLFDKPAEDIMKGRFGVEDTGVLTAGALGMVAQGLLCVTNGTGC